MLFHRRGASPVARLRLIPATTCFALLHWSNSKGRWTTCGPIGLRNHDRNRMIKSAHEFVANDPLFRIPRGR
jgi:hypothetical protein